MRPILLGVAFLLLPATATAANPPSTSHDFDQIRLGVDVVAFSGTRLVGVGSREHYRGAAGDFELFFTKFFSRRLGLELVLLGAPSNEDRRPEVPPSSFLRGEAGVDVAVTTWGGGVPGSLLLGVGAGADYGRYWFAPRGYPYAMARVRLWPPRHASLQAQYSIVPVSLGAPVTSTWEQRVELATSISLLQFGLRLAYTDAIGGVPSRSYFQGELGMFVGLVLM